MNKEIRFDAMQWVLVRDFSNEKWTLGQFSHYDKDKLFPYVLSGGNSYQECIPYEENKQLRGTKNGGYVPNDGDFIAIEEHNKTDDEVIVYKWICIFKSFDDGHINFYVGMEGTDGWLLSQGNPSYINRTFKEIIRPADFAEKEKLELALKLYDKVWNKDKKIVEKIK